MIGNLYMTTSFGFFLFGGVLALLMRAELARPGLQLFTAHQYNQLFTVHGTIMMLLFATPRRRSPTGSCVQMRPDALPRHNALRMLTFGA
ncbi:cbb3-type cytochrome c oxidase subunit I [Streptomyces sp. DHE17-7]|uniref:cbb3-type cytochrome c oxidase subunit I n=1 Tax=Streptomyces sp. DHE17-7 TaxID=2759949 RepID=UPI0022EB7078|nr:cbb3-type cytochrome c oxidase subunit I [Streptomyces sp. DHE17-7]